MGENYYDEQLIQLIMEELRAFRNYLREEKKGISIPSKFELLLASIPKDIRIKIINKMEPDLIKLQKDKDMYERAIKYKSGYTKSDKEIHFYGLELNTYTPFLSIVIDELDAVFRRKEDSKTLDPSRRFG